MGPGTSATWQRAARCQVVGFTQTPQVVSGAPCENSHAARCQVGVIQTPQVVCGAAYANAHAVQCQVGILQTPQVVRRAA